MISCLVATSTIVDMLMGPEAMSVRIFWPLIFVVIVGEMFWPACAAIWAIPPSMVVVCTMVKSARSAAVKNTIAATVENQRFIRPPQWLRDSSTLSADALDGQHERKRALDVDDVGDRLDVGPLVERVRSAAGPTSTDRD